SSVSSRRGPTPTSSAGQQRLSKNVFDAIEQSLIGLIADRRRFELFLGQRFGELLEQLPLLFRKLLRCRDLHGHQEIAAPTPRYIGHALAADAERTSGLRAGWNGERFLAVERGNLNLTTERQRGEVKRDLAVEIVAIPLEERVLLNVNDHVQVARRATARSSLAFAGEPQPLAGGDPRPDAHVEAR